MLLSHSYTDLFLCAIFSHQIPFHFVTSHLSARTLIFQRTRNFLRSNESVRFTCLRVCVSKCGCLERQMVVAALAEEHFICLATVGCPCQGRWWRQWLGWLLVRWGHNELERAQYKDPFFGTYARDGSGVKGKARKASKQAGRQEGS